MLNLVELENCEDLTKKQCDALKYDLRHPFEMYLRETKLKKSTQTSTGIGQIREAVQMNAVYQVDDMECTELDQNNEKIGSLSGNLKKNIGRDFTFIILPLIQFSAEVQEGFPVDKFYLSEDGVEELCNLVAPR